MNYSELCKAFYIKRGSIGIKEQKSQRDIADYLILSGIDQAKYEDYLPQSEDAYAKWFSGATSPKDEIWKAVSKIDEKKYAVALEKELVKEHIKSVAKNLGIRTRTGEEIEPSRLALSIAKTLISMSEHGGVSEKEPKDYYEGTASSSRFSEYIHYAKERYNLMKLIGGEEVLLDDYFVCNSIGEKIKFGVDRSKVKSGYIDDATIEKIRDFYSKKGLDRKSVV